MTITKLKETSLREIIIGGALQGQTGVERTAAWTRALIDALANKLISSNIGIETYIEPIAKVEGDILMQAHEPVRVDTGVQRSFGQLNPQLNEWAFEMAVDNLYKVIKKNAVKGVAHVYTIEFVAPVPASSEPGLEPVNLEVFIRFMQ